MISENKNFSQNQAVEKQPVSSLQTTKKGSEKDISTKPVTALSTVAAKKMEQVAASSNFSMSTLLFYLWLMASGMLGIKFLLSFLRGYLLLSHTKKVKSRALLCALNEAKTLLSITAEPELHESNQVNCPMIWCWSRNPKIIIPTSEVHDINHEGWVSLYCHELAHWKRRDHLMQIISDLLLVIYPWNPIVVWANRRMMSISEDVCDNWCYPRGILECNTLLLL